MKKKAGVKEHQTKGKHVGWWWWKIIMACKWAWIGQLEEIIKMSLKQAAKSCKKPTKRDISITNW